MQTLQTITSEKQLSNLVSKIIGYKLQEKIIFWPEELGAFGVNIKDSKNLKELKFSLRQLIFSGLDSKIYWDNINNNNKKNDLFVYLPI